MIYTSGSTGVPKGAMVEQRGLLNHLLSKISDLELSASDVIAQTAPQSFVISVWQFLAPLMVGARVHICADEEVRDPALLCEVIRREGVTVLQIVPTLLRAILERMPDESDLSRAEPTSLADLHRGSPRSRSLSRLVPALSRRALINAYGSAECSDDVATHRLDGAGAARHRADRPPHRQHTPLCAGRSLAAGADRGRGGAVRRRHRRGPRLSQRPGTDPSEASFATRSRTVAQRACTGPETWPAGAPTGRWSFLAASTTR